ncbi:MAG: GDSL-type esterase/lipase family protein [Phycisphaerae bacterium]|jgi:lysophospholipase L1-like esterase
MKHYILLLLAGFFYENSALAEAQNLITNPQLEKSIAPWRDQSYWSGTVSYVSDKSVAHSGLGCMKLVSAEKNGSQWGRIYQAVKAKNFIGRYYYNMWVKGKGELALGIIKYVQEGNKQGNSSPFWQDSPVKLTGEWQEVSFEFTIADPQVSMVGALVEVRGEGGEAFIDDVSLSAHQDVNVTIEARQKHQILPEGSELLKLSFKLSKLEKPLSEAPVDLYVIFPDGSNTITKGVTDANGICFYSPDHIKPNMPGVYKVMCSAPESGVLSEVFIDVIDRASYAEMDAIARKVKLTKPLRVLYLGDSLTDYFRGHNYTDKIDFWLNQYNPGMASFRNAGVGGDFITRIWERIQGMESGKNAYRQIMYEGLFDTKPDVVFIFLGHNDTKASSASGYKTPFVDLIAVEETYRKLIDYIRAKTDARIVLMSSSSSFFPVCQANAEKQAAVGKEHRLFGQPEMLEAFNAAVEKLSQELHLDYVDIYTPTKDHPDKAGLFSTEDGIHLTEKGNSFIEMLLLRYFSKSTEEKPFK